MLLFPIDTTLRTASWLKMLGEINFFSDTEAFFNNAGTARPLVCVGTAIKPMVAAELHCLWLESPPEWAEHLAIDVFSFSDDYKIFALWDSKPSPLNELSQKIQTSLCSADSLLLSSPLRLQQLVHGFPAAIRRLPLQRWVIKEQISHSECGRRAVSLPPVRVMPTQSLCTHRDGMLVRVWVSRSPPAHSDAFIKASLLPHFSSLSKARRMKHRRYGAEQLGLNDPTLAKPPAYSFFPQHSETILSSRKAAECAAFLGHAQAEPARSPR